VDETEALAERVYTSAIAALELASIHIGRRLGYYRALDGEPLTPAELAARTGTAERYAREWLEQQAVAGFLSVDDGRFSLPAAFRPVFLDAEDLNHIAPLATLAMGVLRPLEPLLEAYRSGGGVPYEAYGDDVREGIEACNRPVFLNQLAGWLAAIPEIDARLRGPARVADLACGAAWSSIALARAYPETTVDAIDLDPDSIAAARANVEAAGLADRVRPAVRDAGDPALGGRYDLVTIFEALHDMNHPVAALRAARALLAEGGCVLVADEKVAERFAPPGNEKERSSYAFSLVHCLPVGMLEAGSAGTGAVMRPATLHRYAREAGFERIETLAVEHDFWRFYVLA
jgi:2-polyprenyl-3-methyl-5-hydroxy-6-metoxy-1,4-benzoquinol methylase